LSVGINVRRRSCDDAGDRDTGVRVVLRARPLNALERSKAADQLCLGIEGDAVECRMAKGEHAGSVRFSFDKVFGPDSEQKQVYDFIGPQAIHGTGSPLCRLRLPLCLTALVRAAQTC
jgi:hypothetical protein